MTRRPAAPLLPAVLPTRSARRSGPASVVALVLVATLVGLLAAPLVLAALASRASAHDALSGSAPADGATVATPPASVDLTFSEPPLEIGTEVRVTGPDGAVVDGGTAVVSGTTVSQPLVAELPAGAYAVAWRVTSADGHPISGELAFTATAGTASSAPTDAPSPAPTDAGGTADGVAGPTEEPAATAEPEAQTTTAAEPPELAQGAGADVAQDPSRGAVPWFLAGTVLLAAGAAAWWAARRRAATRDRG